MTRIFPAGGLGVGLMTVTMAEAGGKVIITFLLFAGKSGRPAAGEHVMVYCQGFSCPGYHGRDRSWITVFSNEKLSNVIDFSPLD